MWFPFFSRPNRPIRTRRECALHFGCTIAGSNETLVSGSFVSSALYLPFPQPNLKPPFVFPESHRVPLRGLSFKNDQFPFGRLKALPRFFAGNLPYFGLISTKFRAVRGIQYS
ncbi:hypothetical protein SLE2022_300180 [Rubroshorea leprosula]